MWKHVGIGIGITLPVVMFPVAWGVACRRVADWTITHGWLDAQLAHALGRGFAVLPILVAFVAFASYMIARGMEFAAKIIGSALFLSFAAGFVLIIVDGATNSRFGWMETATKWLYLPPLTIAFVVIVCGVVASIWM